MGTRELCINTDPVNELLVSYSVKIGIKAGQRMQKGEIMAWKKLQ